MNRTKTVRELAVTLAPISPGFHVYSTAHDLAAAQGLGIPTSIAIVEGATAKGPWLSDVPAQTVSYASLGAPPSVSAPMAPYA